MRRLAFLFLVLALSLGLTGSAFGQTTQARRIAKLERQVKTLRTQVAKLRNAAAFLLAAESCRKEVAGISQFPGYIYDPDGPGPAPEQYETALDFSGGGTPQIFVEIWDAGCVGGQASARRTSAAATRSLTLWKKAV